MQKIGDIPNTRADSHGEFTDGNVAGGVPPTILPAEWFNTIQRELMSILAAAEIEADSDAFDQVLLSIQKLVSEGIPDLKDASLTQKGIVQLSSSITSTSEALAATPKAVKAALDASLPIDGTAASATKLATARKIGGVDFDGTKDITLPFISTTDTNIQLAGNLTAQGSLIAKTNIAADGRCDIVGDVRGGRIISKSDVIAGEGRAEGHVTLTVDGNIYGTLWGTDLYTYLAEQLIGIPMPYPLSSVPAGYLKCNGAAFSTSAYPRLALKYPSGVLPDMRGNVIRGWDDGRRIDAGRVLLSFQDDAIRNITGVYAPAGGKAVEPSYFSGAFTRLDVPAPQGGQVVGGNTVQGAKFDASRVVPTASENRMKNIAFNYIVRAL